MKWLIILIVICWTQLLTAQDATDSVRDKALYKAETFCGLLKEFSTGGEKYLTNDEKIFDLCSSKNISAYDDLRGNREGLLISYLFTIIQDYNNQIKMEFTTPVIEEVFSIPEFQFSVFNTSGFSDEIFETGNKDTFVIMSTVQTIPSLNLTTHRNIIYSSKEDKIVAFSVGESPYVLFNKAILSLKAKDYATVYTTIDHLLKIKRCDPNIKADALEFAFESASREMNTPLMQHYLDLMHHLSLADKYSMMGRISYNLNKKEEAIRLFEKSAELGNESFYPILGWEYMIPMTPYQNIQKSRECFVKGIRSTNDTISGFAAYSYFLAANLFNEYFNHSINQQLFYLEYAAKKKFEAAYIPLSELYESLGNDDDAAFYWIEAAKLGSGIGFARLGRYLLKYIDEEPKNKEDGIFCLQEALKYDIASELEGLNNLGIHIKFPADEQEIRSLLLKYE